MKLIALVGVLTAVFLVPANLQTMTDALILPSRREHLQQSVEKYVEQLQGLDASLRLHNRCWLAATTKQQPRQTTTQHTTPQHTTTHHNTPQHTATHRRRAMQ